MSTDEQTGRVAIGMMSIKFAEQFGYEALSQVFEGIMGPANNRGGYTFGKTEIDHLTKRYMDKSQPLWLRLVDCTKVHARYRPGTYADPNLTWSPAHGELAEVLLGHSGDLQETKNKQLQRAVKVAKEMKMLTDASSRDCLSLPTGEWSKRASRFSKHQKLEGPDTSDTGHSVSRR